MIILIMNGSWSGYTQLKNHVALHLNFIQVYSLEVVKSSFSHLSIGKIFWTGKKKSCYDDWNTFLHFVSIAVVQWEFPGE